MGKKKRLFECKKRTGGGSPLGKRVNFKRAFTGAVGGGGGKDRKGIMGVEGGEAENDLVTPDYMRVLATGREWTKSSRIW